MAGFGWLRPFADPTCTSTDSTTTDARAPQLTHDYAPDGAWLELRSHCAEAKEAQFSYKLCLFDKAQQVDNNGGHRTNLGEWRGFDNRYMEVGAAGAAGAACVQQVLCVFGGRGH